MPLTSAASNGLIPFEEWIQGKMSSAREERDSSPEEPEDDLTPEEQEEFEIVTYCNRLYDDARRAREPYETFDVAWDLYVGNVWGGSRWPSWRAKISLNKIRAFITFMAAVMTDNKPRISVEPTVPGTEDAADLLRKLVDRTWTMKTQSKLSVFVIYMLIWGTSFIKVTYDPYADGGRGKHLETVIPPYRVFTNRTATSIEDAEVLIQSDDATMGWIRRGFPDKAKQCHRLRGITNSDRTTGRDRDYIREGEGDSRQRIVSAQNINGNITAPQYSSGKSSQHLEDDDDTVEVLEYWLRDDSLEMYERQKVVNGVKQTKPMIGPDGMYVMEKTGEHPAISEIDGSPFMAKVFSPKQEPDMESCWRPKYPNGRLVLIAGGRVLLRDVPSPFQTNGFPWAMAKDYDTGGFWGCGEALALKDPQIASNKILSRIYDILEKIGSPSYKLKKGGGVNAQSIKDKPGLIIPMDDMDSLQPLQKPEIPKEFFELYSILQTGMREVSGLNEAVTGSANASNTAFATIDSLQESGAAPIRGKVRNFEEAIQRFGELRVQLIQQWDQGERPLRLRPDGLDAQGQSDVVQPFDSVATKFRTYKNADLQGSVEFEVTPISSLSTSPSGTWNRWLQLKKEGLVDTPWWHSKFRLEGWRTQLPRMMQQQKINQAADAAAKAASKVKPGPPGSRPLNHPKNQQTKAPPSHVPSRHQNASVR
jgi:hypothetical protein